MRTIKEIFRSYAVLDADGRHTNGTDKQSNHGYGDAYERILTVNSPSEDPSDVIAMHYPRSLRGDVRLMMEVGVADGSCLLAWREIFPNALCVGMDIHHSDRAHGERIEFHFGDQRNKEHCERAAAGRQFDFIVEDATHEIDATLLTLLYLWPFVKPGGLYVIEEFSGIHGLWKNVEMLWPFASIVNTVGPFGGNEPLVVLRKPL